MRQALRLARRGLGKVEPNPAVGCVIVKGGRVIGKGWHSEFGGPHAEIYALEDCKASGRDPAGADMYVTLEPCSHHGKTPPCTDAIIEARLGRVVVAAIDPSPHAAGKGIDRLRAAGISVETGVCQREALLLNRAFIKFTVTQRPWVIVKWAQSLDGKLARKAGGERWISNEQSRKDAHKLRRKVGAILVGINTVLADDPLLTARPGRGRQPLRIVLDSKLRLPAGSCLLATAKKVPLLVVTTEKAHKNNQHLVEQITLGGGEVFAVAENNGRCDIGDVLDELGRRKIINLLVEGGAEVIAALLKGGFADELQVYVAGRILGDRGEVDVTAALARVNEPSELSEVTVKNFGGNVRLCGLLRPVEYYFRGGC